MYDWWGKFEGFSFETIKSYVKYSTQKNRLPITYGLFLDNNIIGLYQFRQEDLFARPDIYPWLANVYIDKPYRNMGFGKFLLESVPENARKDLNFEEIYLYTEYSKLYEKFGWEFISEIDTFLDECRIQRLYRLIIKR